MLEAFDIVGDEVEHIAGQIIGLLVVVTVLGGIDAHRVYILIAHEVRGKRFAQRVHRDHLLVVDQFLNRQNAVDKVGNTDGVQTVSHTVLGATQA